jgi:fatty-acyl-CoA synthase
VVGIPDRRWAERPLAVVVFKPGQAVAAEELRRSLEGKVPSFWLPDAWAVLDDLPTTSVGKRDKLAIRAMHEQGRLTVTRIKR